MPQRKPVMMLTLPSGLRMPLYLDLSRASDEIVERRLLTISRNMRVALIELGGTISMQRSGVGGPLKPGRLNLHQLPPQLEKVRVSVTRVCSKDSVNLTESDLKRLHEKIAEYQNNGWYDGVVVVCGTDRMAEVVHKTAYCLKELRKPVIFTGALLPPDHPSFDGRDNLNAAIALAAVNKTPSILALFRRESEKKVFDTWIWKYVDKAGVVGPRAFRYPGAVEKTIRLLPHPALKFERVQTETRRPTLVESGFARVAHIHLEQHSVSTLPRNAKAVLIHSLGAGNISNSVRRMLVKLRNNKARRGEYLPVAVVMTAHGPIEMHSYEPSALALKDGFLPAAGLRPTPASVRLSWLAARLDQIKEAARKNNLGENGVHKLFATLFLSGLEFGFGNEPVEEAEKRREAHSKALGVPILGKDLLVEMPFANALEKAVDALKKNRGCAN
ncbi:MAG: asparaginase [Candidatus Norongarragalinales archaeon]